MDFKINLSGNLGSTANADADALKRLHEALTAERKMLAGMEAQMRAIQKAGVVDIQVYRQLSAAIQSQRDKVAALTVQQAQAGRAGLAHTQSMREQAVTAGTLASFVGNVLAQAFVRLVGVVRNAAAAIIQFSEARGDAVRGLETLFRSEEAAENTYNAIVDVTKRVAISQQRALEIADSLQTAGMNQGDAMVRAIETIGKAEAARRGAGQALQGVIERSQKAAAMGARGGFSISRDEILKAGLTYRELAGTLAKQTGIGVREAELALRTGRVSMKAGLDALTATVDGSLGAIANKKFLTIANQSNRLKETFGRLFERLDTSKIGAVLSRITDWLSESSVSGAALQEVFTRTFDALGDAIEFVWPYVQTFFDFLILTALKIWNAFYPVRQMFADVFGGGETDLSSFEDTLLSVSNTIGDVASLIADDFVPITVAALALLTPAVWSFASGVIAATWPVIAFVAAVKLISVAVTWIIDAVTWLVDVFKKTDWSQLGSDIVNGLVNGVKAGVSWVKEAFGNLAKAGLDKFKSFFGIHSPSTVMALQGRYLDEGLEQGIERNSDGPASALAGAAGSPSSVVENNSTRSNSANVVFAEGSVVLNFNGGSESAADQVRAQMPQIMADIFEQLGFTMGAEGAA